MNAIDSSYGIYAAETASTELEIALEELRWQGFHILRDVLTPDEIREGADRLDAVLANQEEEFGLENLDRISDRNLARVPLAYDPWFLKVATHPRVLAVARALIGDHIILHTQNGILNPSDAVHHQSKWHRDIPYQEWTSSRPIAMATLFCFDDFSPKTGGTYVLPFSQKFDKFPSEHYVGAHELPVTAPAGSAIMFDAMLYHRAGSNSSGKIRRGVNNVFATPILKQQIDIPRMLGPDFPENDEMARFLGYTTVVRESVRDYRANKLKRLP